jgi:hypothetical protein
MFQTKFVEKIKTNVIYSVTFSENPAVYEICGKILYKQGRPQMTIWLMSTACWTPKATDKHSEYVKLIAFPR